MKAIAWIAAVAVVGSALFTAAFLLYAFSYALWSIATT